MKKKSISIIVPIYNAGNCLKRCISSLLEVGSNDEIILINDGSTDESLELCENYSATHPNIKVFDQKNSGVSSARNVGIQLANGEWIMFVDADDELIPGWRNVIGLALQKIAEDCDVIVFAHDIQNRAYTSAECSKAAFGFEKSLGESWGFSYSKLYKKQIIDDNNISFSVGLINGEDMIFNANVFALSRVVCGFERSIYRYYKNMGSATNRFNPKIIETEHVFHTEMRKIICTYFSNDQTWNEFYVLSLLTGLYAVTYRLALSSERNYYLLETLIQESEYKLALEQLDMRQDYLSKNKYIDLNMLRKERVHRAIRFTKAICTCKKIYHCMHKSEEILKEI